MGSLVKWFDDQFAKLSAGWNEVLAKVEPAELYQPLSGTQSPSVGEDLVKSAGTVEQAFGGITANLWDDPFEWTLPETLTTHEKLREYFGEVEATRRRGFELIKADQDLVKAIMAPAGETQLATLLLDTLLRARHYHLRATEASKQIARNRRSRQIVANRTC
jgi:hypothetical protein